MSTQNKTEPRKRIEVPHRAFRTAVGNGSRWLENIDGRTTVARRYGELAAAISSDLGGSDQLSEALFQLIRSAAGLIVLRENLDAKAVNGEPIDVATYCKISNSLRRVLDTIGLRRVPRDITTLGQILREGQREGQHL